ncbi:MAG: hypothetical protein ACK4YE_06850 [Bacteroidota bacterium]|jgi:hypothetical protein
MKRRKYNIYDFLDESSKPQKPQKIKHKGFEKMKDSGIKYKLQSCSKVIYNKRKHYTIKELGFNTIYRLSSKGNKRWDKYFQDGGKVFIKSYSTHEPMCNRVLFEKKIKKYIGTDVPLPKKKKPQKRNYIKGGVGGKVYGFDFYPREDKLYPKQRNILLKKSEDYIQQIIDEQNKYRGGNIQNVDIVTLTHLDSSLTDLENIETWNNFFQKYGMRFPEFEEKWMRLFGVNQIQPDDEEENQEGNEIMRKKVENFLNIIKNRKGLGF